ncbi:hypothetical protein ACFXEL_31565 [Streptomyces sp. NPDC059382]|uniref:hypothetical protein n=1 Tax=Streptomyces sp. NPDC059382 TaxID=3346816 RepID=UPI00367B75F0
MSIRIIDCTSPTELFRHYDGQSEAQPAYIELDLPNGLLLADYNAVIGNAVPPTVRNGQDRRYTIPVLTADAANRVMKEIAPLADRILADWEEVWDGNNTVVRLGEDARAAEDEIEAKLGLSHPYDQAFEEKDLIGQWDVDAVLNGLEAEEYDITADTGDERLCEIEAEILASMAGGGDSSVEDDDSPVIVCAGLEARLRRLREDAATDQEDEG